MKTLCALVAAFLLAMCAVSHAATSVNLQTCTVTPTSGGLIGCPTASVSFAPVAPTTLVRSQVAGAQGWRPFSTLKPTDSVVSADGQWHVLSSITPALQPTSPPPVVIPPVVPPPTDVWVPLSWTCSIANHLATCTAPVTP